jgi:hypothetical protein
MSDAIERPVFFEGQILGALDLDATVGYSRDQVARHERYLHTWGIAEGLKLSPKPKQLEISGATYDYQEIWLSAGLAIDGRGREIVVPEDFRLSESDFDQLNVAINDPTALYPVLLRGIDTTSAASAFSFGTVAQVRLLANAKLMTSASVVQEIFLSCQRRQCRQLPRDQESIHLTHG